MTKKAKTHAQKPADGEQKTGGATPAHETVENGAAGATNGDAADVRGSGAESLSGAAAGDIISEGDHANAGTEQNGGVSDAKLAGGAADDGAELAGAEDEHSHDHLGQAGGDDTDRPQVLDPDGNPPGDQAPPEAANDSDGSADAENTLGRYEQLANEDPSFYAAVEALDYIAQRGMRLAFPEHHNKQIWEIQREENVADWLDGDAFVDAANLIRQIGERANTNVLAQELHLKGHREQGNLKPIERLLLDTFRHNLLILDRFAQAEADKRAAEEAERNKPKPHHTRLEDTMLEQTTGTFDKVF